MNTANVHAGRLERRVRLVGNETMPGVLGCCSLPWFTADCRLRDESALRVASNKRRNLTDINSTALALDRIVSHTFSCQHSIAPSFDHCLIVLDLCRHSRPTGRLLSYAAIDR